MRAAHAKRHRTRCLPREIRPRWMLLGGMLLLMSACGEDAADGRVAHETFLRGNAAFARSETFEAEWRRPGGDPTAFEAALLAAEDALRFWQTAAASRADWPAARRNVERALLRIDGLRERKQTGSRGSPRAAPGTPRPKERPGGGRPNRTPPPPPNNPAGRDPAARPKTNLLPGDLPVDEVLGLFDRLQAKDREKQKLRRAQRRARATAVERDW